jgi:hypothetical protein
LALPYDGRYRLPALREKRSMQVLKGEYKQELMRTLSVPDLVIYGMVFMLPIAPLALFGIRGQITTLRKEVRHEQKHLIGFAGLVTLAIIAVLFIVQPWLTADLAPGAHVISPDTVFYDITRYAGGNGLFALASISTALAFGVPCTMPRGGLLA